MRLVERVRNGNFSEAIMATNPNVEGDGTALFISNQLDEFPIELTRLARGVTSGSVLEFTNKEILADALSGGRNFNLGFRSMGSAEDEIKEKRVIAATMAWLETMVIGLNLCPFAKAIYVKKQIRYAVSIAEDNDALLVDVKRELSRS